MTLTGRLVERRSDRLWQPSVRGRRIEASSDPIELSIQPKPASFSGDHWLPARALQVAQDISASDAPTVGEPVTRTIILDAVGLEENMLPEPNWPDIQDARIYPDQPQGITRDDGRWVLGHKEFRYAVVPEKAGELVLPELKVSWWDTVNNREQTATLPEQRLTIAPSAVQIPEPAVAVPAPAPGPQFGQDGLALEGSAVSSLWRNLTIAFAVLWLGTLFLLLRQRQAKPETVTRAEQVSQAEGELLKEFQRACEQADAGKARQSLGRWLKRFGPAGLRGSLVEFARESADPTLAARLRELDAVGFQADSDYAWDAAGTWAAFKAWQQAAQSRKTETSPAEVTDLYAR